jgi:hypothetical protein
MRILLIAALVSSVAVAGCRGGEKNTSTAASNSASANGSGSASGGAGGGGTADAFRQLARTQCQQAIQNNPSAPKGFDAAGTCDCAIQEAFGSQADPLTFARSPEGQQALTRAIISCGQQRMGGAAGGNSAGAAAQEEGEDK